MGIPYNIIDDFSEQDIAIIIAIDNATREKEQAIQARSMR